MFKIKFKNKFISFQATKAEACLGCLEVCIKKPDGSWVLVISLEGKDQLQIILLNRLFTFKIDYRSRWLYTQQSRCKVRDGQRDKNLVDLGFTTLRFCNWKVLNEIEAVRYEIEEWIKANASVPPPPPRKRKSNR